MSNGSSPASVRDVDPEAPMDDAAPFSRLASLYSLWLRFEDAHATSDEHSHAEQRLYMQSVIMSLMEKTSCTLIEDVLYKLAIWRWDTLDLEIETADRGARLAYSALEDLARLTGERRVLSKPETPPRPR